MANLYHTSLLTRPLRCWQQCKSFSSLIRPLNATVNDDFTPVAIPQQRRSYSEQTKATLSDYLSPDFPPIGCAQWILETAHDTTGLPWWASIALTTVALRTVVTLPLSVYGVVMQARIQRLRPEIKETAKQLAAEVARAKQLYSWNKAVTVYHYRSNMKRLVKKLYIRDNCHPMKTILVAFIQLPMWFSLSFALRNMAGALPLLGSDLTVLCPALAHEGTLWFSNLLLADTTFILPITLGLSSLLITEMQSLKHGKASLMEKSITNLFRGLSVFIVPIAASVPSCLCLYWTASSLYGLIQNIVLKCPSVRRRLGIPLTDTESTTPFQDMWRLAQIRYLRRTDLMKDDDKS